MLIDGKELAQSMIDQNVAVTPVRNYEVKRLDSEYFIKKLYSRRGYSVFYKKNYIAEEAIRMRYWIFQGNRDTYDIDKCISKYNTFTWSVRQTEYADQMEEGDEVFMWRAAGKSKNISGVVGYGSLIGKPRKEVISNDQTREFWYRAPTPSDDLRVELTIHKKCIVDNEVVRRCWLKEDPVLYSLRIIKVPNRTNFPITSSQADRLAALVRKAGREWSREEAIAALWACVHTKGKPASIQVGSPISEVALMVGRTIHNVERKVEKFKEMSNNNAAKDYNAAQDFDRKVWAEFFDSAQGQIRLTELAAEYSRKWGRLSA